MTNTLKTIAIVGAESTGKTWLTESLAKYYTTNWVIEFSRHYLHNLGRPYRKNDVEVIAKGQLSCEDTLRSETDKLLFCDTNMLVIKVWMDHAYGETPDWVLREIETRHYDLHLVTDYHIPYQPDPLREHPEMRDYFHAMYLEELKRFNIPYVVIEGDKEERMNQAVALVDELLHAR